MSQRELLLAVARCAGGSPPSPRFPECASVVAAQDAKGASDFQVPEAWRGDLANARLLFVSSNPGLNRHDDCPTADQSDQAIVDYYSAGFPEQFPKNLDRAGRPNPRAVSFWSSILKRASELYGRSPKLIRPGTDFAITETVHCKSPSEAVARSAARQCVAQHFGSIARISSARVVVILGAFAADALGLPNRPRANQRAWYGKDRLVLWLPHPNARERRTVAALYSAEDITRVQEALA